MNHATLTIEQQAEIDGLINKAESGKDWADICLLESKFSEQNKRPCQELRELLSSARDLLHHVTCKEGIATECRACSLESLIDTALD